MSVTLLVLGGAGVCWAVIWLIARLAKPAAFNRMSDTWLDSHKYDRKHTRAD